MLANLLKNKTKRLRTWKYIGKGKSSPLKYRYCSTLSLTSALERVSGQCQAPAALPSEIYGQM